MALAEWTHLDADVDCESEKSTYGLCNVMTVLCWIKIRRVVRNRLRGELNKDVNDTHAWGSRCARYRSVSMEPSSLNPRCL